ncbi:MAG: ABC transporter permease, partial [Nitrospinae bacterium]|nr:ABC transporter permease [Nitrospinota bacterium]
MNHLALASLSLWRREMVRFYRDKSRVIGGLVPPVIFWLFIGSGLSGSFSVGGGTNVLNYRQYFFPGTLVLIFLFTAVFSTISIIEDRKEGFLQSVLVAPLPRLAIVFGK